jgi:hypothetical protein
MERIPVLRKVTSVGALSAQSDGSGRKQRTQSLGPSLPFKIGPMNERKARESGFQLGVSIAPSAHRACVLRQ